MPKSRNLSRNESLMLRHLSEIISYKVGDPSLGLATVSAVELTDVYKRQPHVPAPPRTPHSDRCFSIARCFCHLNHMMLYRLEPRAHSPPR